MLVMGPNVTRQGTSCDLTISSSPGIWRSSQPGIARRPTAQRPNAPSGHSAPTTHCNSGGSDAPLAT